MKIPSKPMATGIEVVSAGDRWKAWGYVDGKLIESDDGHTTWTKAWWQLRHKIRLAGGAVPPDSAVLVRE